MADISATKLPMKVVPYQFQDPLKWTAYDLSPVADGVYATGTHNLFPLAINEALFGIFGTVVTTFTSTSNDGTVKFHVGSVDLNTAITMDGSTGGCLKANETIWLPIIAAVPPTASVVGMSPATADTIDITIATHAITAGRIILYVATFDVAKILVNG